MRGMRFIAVLFALAGAAIVPATAQAAFPGQNGKVAFVSAPWAAGAKEIYTVDPDGSNVTQLTIAGGEDPAWSPDGTKILFVRAGTVWVMNADGSNQQSLGVSGNDPAWSPDGSRIVTGGLFVMNADGSDRTFLTAGSEPAWSPDGSMILFANATNDHPWAGPLSRIWGIRPDGTNLRQLTRDYSFGDGMHYESRPEWAPSANKYVIRRDDDTDTGTGYPTLEVLVVGSNHGIWLGYDPYGAGWSPDGTKIAYSLQADSIWVTSSTSTSESQLVDIPLADETDPDWQPLPVNTPSTYARPESANRVQHSLVPAYVQCTSANRQHGPPLAYGSCAPPQPGSSRLMVGIGDGHPAASRSTGFMRLKVFPGVPGGEDDTTARVRLTITNVMRTSDLSEYTGELRGRIRTRITRKDGTVSATTVDFPLEFTVPCTPTDSTLDKSTCDLGTDLDALVPGATPEQTRAIWQLDQVKVYDGGTDEDGDTTADNSLFAVQGVFVP